MIPEAKTLTWRYCNATLETIDVQKYASIDVWNTIKPVI